MKKQVHNNRTNWVKICLAFLLATTISSQINATTYYWVGGTGSIVANTATTAWSTAGVGGAATGSAVTPTSSDVFIFDGTDISSTAGLQTGAVTFSLSSAITVGQMIFQNGASVTYGNTSSNRNINFSGSVSGNDLVINNGCSFTASGSTLILALGTGTTGSISGSLILGAGSNSQSITAADASGLTINSGGSVQTVSNVPAFGTGTANSVVFANGSTYIHSSSGAGNPFQLTQPSSVVVFQTGSLYRQTVSAAPAMSGRTYSNFEWANSGTQSLTGGSPVVFDSIISSSTGTLNINLTGGVFIKGNIRVASGTVTFTPASTANLYFSGTSAQTVSNSGTLTFAANATVIDTNSTSTVTLSSAVTIGGPLRVSPNCTLATGATLTTTSGATINGTFQLNSSGFAQTGTWTYGAAGTLNFNSSSGYTVSNTHVYWPTTNGPVNVNVLQGGMTLSSASRSVNGWFKTSSGITQTSSTLTLNDSCILNSGGFFNSAPTYGSSSKLVYNTTGSYGVGSEWTGNNTTAGSGVPGSVIVKNSTTVTMPSSDRGVAGLINVISGGITLNATSGDLYLTGNMDLATTSSITHNSRAIFFNGSGTQTLTVTAGGTLSLAYVLLNNSTSFKLGTSTDLTISANSGMTIGNSGSPSIDLNGRTLTFSGGGNLSLSSGSRTINSTGSGTFAVTGSTLSVSSATALSFGSTVTVQLANGMNFGSSISTINGTLKINSGGFVSTNAPTYATSSVLNYNSGTSYGRGGEWNATSGPGYPYDVTLTNNTTVDMGANSGTGTARACAGALNVGGGSTLTLNGTAMTAAVTINGNVTNGGTITLSTSSGGDLKVGGDFAQNGTFTPNSRAVYFVKSSGTQVVSASGGSITIPYVVFDASGNRTVQLSATDLNATAPNGGNAVSFGSSSDILDINGRTVTLGTVGQTCNISGSGNFKGSTSSNMSIQGTTSTGNIQFTSNTNLNNFTENLTSGGTTLNSALTVNGVLTLTAGSLTNSGTLTIATGGSIVRTSGSLAGTAPAYGTLIAVTYNGSGATSGNELAPGSGTIGNVTLNTAGTYTLANDVTVGSALGFTAGKLAINGNTLTLNGTVSGMSATKSLVGSNTSKLTVGSTSSVGTVYFDQTTGADVGTTNGTNALLNLLVTGSGGSVTLGNKVNLFDRLSVTAGTLNTGDVLVLRSTSSNTAYVDQVGGSATISGQTVVERYIHKQARGWRTLTAPVTYNGVTQGYVSGNWQSDFGYGANYGTRISGPSATNGIDDATTGSSLQRYNSTTGAWTKVTNTNTETMSGNSGSADNKGFYIFIRGDRTVTPSGSSPSSFVTTTLAAKGKLQTGTQTFNFSGTANKAWLLGNPYACPVDMSAVSYTNIGNFVTVWDPNLTGYTANTNGNYAAFDRTNWAAGPTSGSSTKFFQSGQGFFVTPNNATASVVFAEANKSNSGNNNTQITGTQNQLADIFNIRLLSVRTDGTRSEVDGARAKFGATYTDGVDENDATKWATTGIENISFQRDGKALVIESRPFITGIDYLYVNTNNLSTGANYEFKINPINFDASVTSCSILDNFLNTTTPVSLTSTTIIPFTVTSVAGSNAANRFTVVFNGTGSLPVCGLNVKAYKQNSNSIVVKWESCAETGVKEYTVEKSTDASTFSSLKNETAKNNNATNQYSFVDNNPNAVNYYRIKTTQLNSQTKLSQIVRVEMNDKGGIKSVTVYPNPVKGNTISLQMSNLDAGKYTAKVFNNRGQEVSNSSIVIENGTTSLSMQLNNLLPAGTYQLQLTNAKGAKYVQQIIVAD